MSFETRPFAASRIGEPILHGGCGGNAGEVPNGICSAVGKPSIAAAVVTITSAPFARAMSATRRARQPGGLRSLPDGHDAQRSRRISIAGRRVARSIPVPATMTAIAVAARSPDRYPHGIDR